LGADVGARPSRVRPAHAEGAPAGSAAKRAFDLVASALLLLVLLPLLAVVAVLVRLDSPGPVFFRCERVGYRGRPLRMLKFRKMVASAGGKPLTVDDDERFTRLGSFLTKYKLDELPQLWHVLRGDMSLVGPRPEDPRFVRRHAAAYYGEILTVRPGVFGLVQLAFAEENRILDPQDPVADYVARILPQKVRLERLYVATRDFRFDLRVLCWAVAAVMFRRPVAVDRQSAALGLRRR
jgi:lipopolysaccharide/colanic/teichoic acid biosynthesis glycosyltransferase